MQGGRTLATALHMHCARLLQKLPLLAEGSVLKNRLRKTSAAVWPKFEQGNCRRKKNREFWWRRMPKILNFIINLLKKK